MKRFLTGILTVLCAISALAQNVPALEQLKADPRKASTIHLVFYRGRRATDDILVKCLLNGYEVTLPVKTDTFPYYKWSDLRACWQAKIDSVE